MCDTYKLIYFNACGMGEPIRFIFKLAGVEFIDERVEVPSEIWLSKEQKANYPWGTLPVLEVGNPQKKTTFRLAQSATIGRFLAKRFNMCGAGEEEFAKCDEYVDALKDFHRETVIWFKAKDEDAKSEKMAELKEKIIPQYFGRFNKILEESATGWLNGGAEFTWADIFVGHGLTFYERLTGEPGGLLAQYPEVEKLCKRVFALPPIAKWIKERPETPF